MKTKLLLLTLLFSMTLSFGQGSGEVIITEIYNRPNKPNTAQMVDDAYASQPAYWTDNGANTGSQVDNDEGDEGHTEWFEIYNTTALPVVMDGWTLTDASSSSNVTTIGSYTIQPEEFAVFTGYNIPVAHGLNPGDTFGDYIYDYKKPSFNNESSYADSGDTSCPDGVIISKPDGVGGFELVDEVKYDYGYGEYIGNPGSSASCSGNAAAIGFPDQNGSSRVSFQLDNNYLNATDNDDPTYWTFTDDSVPANEYDTVNGQHGTPGAPNYADPALSNEEFLISNFKVYPNPANDFITIESNTTEISSIAVYDILGKNVHSQKELTNNRLDVSKLNNGVYFLKINVKGNSTTKKIIID